MDGYVDFVQWKDVGAKVEFEVYIEKEVLYEYKKSGKDLLLIDAVVNESNGKKFGMLFFNDSNIDAHS